MLGTLLGHFRILELLGVGGMGVVYRARDERLERDVALKILPPGTLVDPGRSRRFRQEALALSRLNHPNVATVHDFFASDGMDVLVMEFIEGLTVEEMIAGAPLPASEVVRLGSQLALGLATAHEQGVVHRDLKPGNLRVTADGRLKILDFGLAELQREAHASTRTSDARRERQTFGSPPYMAPEQLVGSAVDARSDIYAAGAVLYEMATGLRPFGSAGGPRLVEAILHDQPASPQRLNGDVPPELAAVILRALRKDPARRQQTPRELLAELRRCEASELQPAARGRRRGYVTPTAAAASMTALLVAWTASGAARSGDLPARSGISSVAVLPMHNLSGDADQEYLADGLTDGLIAALARASSARVISRSSAMRYKGSGADLARIGRALGVEAVVQGSVLRDGSRVRVTASLLGLPGERALWAESYKRELRDLPALQAEMADTIGRHIGPPGGVSKSSESAGAVRRATDPAVYEAYLKGRYFYALGTSASMIRAVGYFEEALAADPGYAPAWSGLADAQIARSVSYGLDPPAAYGQARAAAARAVQLEPELAEARATLAYAALVLDHDFDTATREFQTAMELNPALADAREQYAWYLAARGRLDEALLEMRRARELDPLSPLTTAAVGGILMYRRELPQAIEHLTRALELAPDSATTHHGLARVYVMQGRVDEAIAVFERLLRRAVTPSVLAELAYANALAGREVEAQRYLDRWTEARTEGFVRYEQAAPALATLSRVDEALALLERAFRLRSPGVLWLKVDPRFDRLRSEERFQALVAQLQLPS